VKQDVQLHHARLRVEGATDYRDLFLAVPMACRVLGHTWGVRPEADGKTVWFEVALRARGTEGR
jgi:hypothetical protein